MLLWESFLLAFSALLPLINPFGSSLVFLGLVGEAPPEVYRSLARRIAINNIIFLMVIELLGAGILKFFGISLPIVQVSGGIVIASMGWAVLNAKDEPMRESEQAEVKQELRLLPENRFEQKAFYPYTFPVTSGPGTIVVLLTLTAHTSTHNLSQDMLGHLGIFLAAVAISGLVYICYASAPKLTSVISRDTSAGILRVVAFILLCIGVQIAWNGLSSLLTSLLHPAKA